MAALSRRLSALDDVVQAARQRGGRAKAVACDVADWAGVQRAVGQILERLGRIDILVNNAAVIGQFGDVWELDAGRWSADLATNVVGPFNLARAALPGMIARGQGVVVNVTSGMARSAANARSAYTTSKAAIDQLSNVMAAEARPHGVRVHAFSPGLVNTGMQRQLREEPGLPGDVRADFVAHHDEGRLQPPEVPAAALAWLASPAGAAWPDLLLSWGDPATRDRLRSLPGFPRQIA